MAGRDRGGVAATLIATAAALLLAAPASGAVTHRVDHGGSDPSYERRATGYWTPARMRSAEPLDPTVAAPSAYGAAPRVSPGGSGSSGASGAGPAGTIDPQPPARTSAASSSRIRAPRYTAGPVPVQAYGTYPFSAHGKLFFTRGGNAFVCSGTSVASGSRSTVLTAGHCVNDKPYGWSRRIIFIPAYWNGFMPFGAWPVKFATAPRAWVRRGDYSYDSAALKVVAGPSGRLGKVVGGIGLAWGQPRRQRYAAIGYPNNLFGGQAMYTCLSRSAGKDPFSRGRGPAPTGIGCNMSSGASGGGWMISKRNNGKRRPFLNSVSSFRYDNKPNLLFGPYFTARVRDMVRAASRRG